MTTLFLSPSDEISSKKKRLWLRPLKFQFQTYQFGYGFGFMVLRFIPSIRLCGNEIKRQLTNYGNQINCLET